MTKLVLQLVAAAALATIVAPSSAEAQIFGRRSVAYPWHAGYVDPQWSGPHAMVVPPTTRWQAKYQWGAAGTEMRRIHARYSPGYGNGIGLGGGAGGIPAPVHPSHTDQLGTYYIRMPRD